MQVNLKQKDIEEALKQYLTREGIQTTGKTVNMAFKNSRKTTGVSVSVEILDNDIPNFEDVKPKLAVVPTPVVAEPQESTPTPPDPPFEDAPVEDAPKATSSLFS